MRGIFALLFLRRLFQDPTAEEFLELKAPRRRWERPRQGLVAEALSKDERQEVNVILGSGPGSSSDQEVLLLVKHMAPRLTVNSDRAEVKVKLLVRARYHVVEHRQRISLDLKGSGRGAPAVSRGR